jgi:hypothetical protein
MRVYKNLFVVAMLALVSSVAGGCSHSKPTKGDGEDVAKRLLVKNCKGDCIDITDFTKTDGTMTESKEGVKQYVLEYEATGKAKVPCWVEGINKLPQMEPVSFDAFHATTEKEHFPTAVPAGTELKFRGEFRFFQSENGWRSMDIEDRDKDGKVIYY